MFVFVLFHGNQRYDYTECWLVKILWFYMVCIFSCMIVAVCRGSLFAACQRVMVNGIHCHFLLICLVARIFTADIPKRLQTSIQHTDDCLEDLAVNINGYLGILK